MESLIWAFGSTLALMIILLVLPFGFTIKGRILIVITGFVLAFGGLAAVTTFPLWQTALILLVLVFFTAYILNGRIGASLFKGNQAKSGSIIETDSSINDPQLENDSLIEVNKINDSNRLEEEAPTLLLEFVEPELSTVQAHVAEVSDEEISFLLDREEADNESEIHDLEENYLEDIDNMLAEEPDEHNENLDQSWLDELSDIDELVQVPPISFEKDKQEAKIIPTEILTAVKEAAASTAQDESLPIKK